MNHSLIGTSAKFSIFALWADKHDHHNDIFETWLATVTNTNEISH